MNLFLDIIDFTLLTGTNEVILGLWNTVAGGNQKITSLGSSAGCHFFGEIPEYAFDQVSTTKYTNFGNCNVSELLVSCGINTGFFIPLRRGSSLLLAFRIRTGNDLVPRDPLTVTIEGSNQPTSALILGSSWTLIYNGSTGLDTDPGRYNFGVIQNLTNNLVWYKSYRFLFISKRNSSDAIQYGEVELYGY